MKLSKRTRRFILYPILLAGGCHTLLTGSPVPTWHIERLNSPVVVKSIMPEGLVLGDGRAQKLPLVRRLPANDPLMLAAVKHGIEITADGNIFGLLWLNRICGNDPCAWDRRRVNLALLAAILLPDNLDESEVPADVIAAIHEYDRLFVGDVRPHRYDEGRINAYDLARMRRIEEELDHSRKRVEKQEAKERWQWTFPANDLLDE